MTYQEFKQAVIRHAEAMGIAEYEIYYQAEESTSVSAFRHELNQFTSSVEGGLCFRCIVNGKMGYASTEALNEEQAERVVRTAHDNALALEADDPVFLVSGGQDYEKIDREGYELPKTEELIKKVLDTQEQLYAAAPTVIDGSSTQGMAISMDLAMYNSKGLDLNYHNNMSAIIVGAVVSDGKEMENDYQIKLGKLDTLDTEALTAKAAKTAMAKLGGEVAPTAVCPVVFDPEAMSDLLSTFSGVFSSEAAQKGLSKLADKEGQLIASSAVTLVDDPFYKDNPMPIPFDAEGSPTCRKALIEEGRLMTLLYNLKTAAIAGKKTTGNASKGSYNASLGVRPFTMYLAPGELTEEELLEKAGNGVYINSLSGLHAGADAVTGDFSLQSAGYLIENGKKTTHVKSFTVAGNFYDLLFRITAVGKNLELPMATGSTAFASPSVLVEKLSIAGK
ncbi:MAG: TldD/PmbA family protein [Oscillospiraceae bacterium]|nr:TldD/PmbA family protein [Oscillospiraceae bacterium]